jgi:hypothetical protein
MGDFSDASCSPSPHCFPFALPLQEQRTIRKRGTQGNTANMKTLRKRNAAVIAALVCALIITADGAEEDQQADLAQKLQNPVADLFAPSSR